MIWATVSSRSCFSWLHRISPSLTTNNIINLISVLTIWWCPCITSSPGFVGKYVCYDQSWQNSLSLCHGLIRAPRPNLPVMPSIFWLTSFAFQSPMKKRTFFFFNGVSSRRSWVAPHRAIQLCFLQDWWLGHKLELLWCEWLTLEMNHFVIFKIAPKYCISDSLVDFEGYSISSLSHTSRYNGHVN